MARYSKKSQDKVEKVMHEYKHGELKSGPKGKGGKVKSRRQAIAIGLSEARKEGAKVPPPKSRKTSAKKKSAPRKKRTARKSSTRRKSS